MTIVLKSKTHNSNIFATAASGLIILFLDDGSYFLVVFVLGFLSV